MVSMFFFRLNGGNVLEEIDDRRDDQRIWMARSSTSEMSTRLFLPAPPAYGQLK